LGAARRSGSFTLGKRELTANAASAMAAMTQKSDFIDEARTVVVKAAAEAVDSGSWDVDTLRRVTRRAVGRLVADRTKRRPMIVPVVMEA